MPQSSLTVFVCSTFDDLVDERAAVLGAIQELQLNHEAMEYFGARSGAPIETCLEEVRRSDLLVVVVGHRYGSLVPDREVSYSQAEYEEGFSARKPCLVYFRDENVPVLLKHVESDPQKIPLLTAFKATLEKQHTVARFKDPGQLRMRVKQDLPEYLAAATEQRRYTEATAPTIQAVVAVIRTALEAGVREGIIVERVQQLIDELVQATIPFRAKVFFSYSHSDAEIVRAVARGLRDRGIDTWIDVENIHLGLSLHDTIASGIQTADFMVFFVSKQTVGRPWLEHELRSAMSRRLSGEHDMVMIPVLLDDVEVPALLRDIKYLDLRDRDIDRAVEELSNAIRAHLKRRERVDESG